MTEITGRLTAAVLAFAAAAALLHWSAGTCSASQSEGGLRISDVLFPTSQRDRADDDEPMTGTGPSSGPSSGRSERPWVGHMPRETDPSRRGEDEYEGVYTGPDTSADCMALRIGLEVGGLVPFGAHEDAFLPGRIAGLWAGFGLMKFKGAIALTCDVRILEGSSASRDQVTGFDVSSELIFLRYDLQLQFIPSRHDVAIAFFLGVGAGIELTSSERMDPYTGKPDKRSTTSTGMLLDTGLVGWIRLAGIFDVVFRAEFDFIPGSRNVSSFALFEAGLQIRV